MIITKPFTKYLEIPADKITYERLIIQTELIAPNTLTTTDVYSSNTHHRHGYYTG